VSEQAGSGHDVAAFCRERGLAASQFFASKKRLSQAAVNQFVEVQVVGTGAAAQPRPAHGRAIEVRRGSEQLFLLRYNGSCESQ